MTPVPLCDASQRLTAFTRGRILAPTALVRSRFHDDDSTTANVKAATERFPAAGHDRDALSTSDYISEGWRPTSYYLDKCLDTLLKMSHLTSRWEQHNPDPHVLTMPWKAWKAPQTQPVIGRTRGAGGARGDGSFSVTARICGTDALAKFHIHACRVLKLKTLSAIMRSITHANADD